MSALWLSTTCRVCLASDREMYRLANTPLEETYERVTSGTLVVEGRPCCVCGVCLSALRRCSRFIDTAREANDALDTWIRNHPNTDTLKLTERPLFSFTQRATELLEIRNNGIRISGVKQEIDNSEDEDNKIIHQNEDTSHDEYNILMEEIKHEVTSDDDDNAYTHVSDDEADKAKLSDNIESQRSVNFEYVNIEEKILNIELDPRTDVKADISEVLANLKAAPGPSIVVRKHPSVDDILLKLKSGKKIKLNADTEIGLKKRKPITSEDRRGNTSPVAAQHGGKKRKVTWAQQSDKASQIGRNSQATKSNGNYFSCLQCNYNTTKQHLLMSHLKTHTGKSLAPHNKLFACNKCNLNFKLKSHLNRHLITHTGVKPITCDFCAFRSRDKNDLKKHLRKHTDERPFVCDVCGLKFRYKNNFVRHSKRHTGEKPFACDKCDYKCTDQSYLKKHLKTHTGEKQFKCSQCDFKSVHWSNLLDHIKTHTGEKPYLCDKCNFKCVQKSSLKAHLMIHTGEKPFLCDKCDYKCSTRGGLKQHLISHSDNKSFACDLCDFKCKMRNSLKLHIMTHTGEKRFACDKCDFKSIQSTPLTRHMRTHTGEKPFACDKCDYKSIEKYKVRRHKKIHNGENLIACDKCDYKCSNKNTLIKHKRKVHVQKNTEKD